MRTRGQRSLTALAGIATAGALALALPIGQARAQDAQALLPTCGACHGSDGNSQIPGTPSLAGQPRLFIENQLVLIREGLRVVPQMTGMLDKVKDEDLTGLAKRFSEMPAKPGTSAVDADKVKRGAEISKAGGCGGCHLPDFVGKDQIPRLAMQREDFLNTNMRQFRDGPPAGRDTIMASTLRGMTDAQISDLAHYFATAGRHPK